MIDAKEFITTPSAAQTQTTLRALEWPEWIEILKNYCRTQVGRERVAALDPFQGATSTQRGPAILELLPLKKAGLELPLSDIPHVAGIVERVARSGLLVVEEFADLVRFHKAVLGLRDFVDTYLPTAKVLPNWIMQLECISEWSRLHFPLLDPSGDITDGASEDLRALRLMSRDLSEKIKARLSEYLNDPHWQDSLQDSYVTLREGRYVLPVKTSHKGRMSGIIHDVSYSEQTTFIEPQDVLDWNNQLKVVDREITFEIEKILRQVVGATQPFVAQFRSNIASIAEADLLSAAVRFYIEAAVSRGLSYCLPEFGEHIDLVRLVHPLLNTSTPVANDLAWQGLLVLTGPNTGGKTVLMKSVGLAHLMARAGFLVVAEKAIFPKDLGRVWADVGDDQSLEQDLSTFSAHLLKLKSTLNDSRPGDLILIDEIATGTSPEEGQPLAQAVLEHLLDRGARVLVTTHYGAIKQFAMTHPRARVAAMLTNPKTQKPTYRLAMDIPGESSAFELARELGFSESILERALRLKGDAAPEFQLAVERLNQARMVLEDERKAVEQKLRSAEEREQRARTQLQEFDRKVQQRIAEESRAAVKEIYQLRDQIAQLLKDLPQMSGESAPKVFEKISDTVKTVQSFQNAEDLRQAVDSIEQLQVGTVVEVDRLGVAEILDLSHGPKKIEVLLGNLRMTVALNRLWWPSHRERDHHQRAKKTQAVAQRRRDAAAVSAALGQSGAGSVESAVCDVRGAQVDDALRRVEHALQVLHRNSLSTVTVVHGHGTERLKDAIRQYLDRDRPDLQYRPGSWPGEGGDGVTIVQSRD